MPLPRLNKTARRALAVTLFQVFFLFGYGVKGNDTGGIIPWRDGGEEYALSLAGQHCMQYGKYAVITSVRPWHGEFIGFVCRRAGRWGPAYNGW